MLKEDTPIESFGALSNSFDTRDIPASAVMATTPRPSRYKTDVVKYGVENQLEWGSCVGQAEGKVIEHFEYIETGELVEVSKRFVYTECKKRDGIPEIQGTFPRVAAKVLTDVGAGLEKDVPDDNRLPYQEYLHPEISAEVYEEAKKRKVKGYTFVNSANLEELLQAIYQYQLVPASIVVGKTSRLPIKPTPSRGNHRIVLIGYEESPTDGRVKIYFLNSWGEKWGESGEGWFWYDEYTGFLFDVMAYTDLPNEMIEDAKAKPFVFTRTLKLGMYGEDVKKLQIKLNQDPDTRVSDIGAGSMGNETTYFGSLTENAVKRFQCKHKIICSGDPESTGYGLVGPKTRALLNSEPEVELYPKVQRLRDNLIEVAEMAGFAIKVTDEYRTFAEQDALYAKGRTTEGTIVTNAKGGESLHNWRCAFDVAFIRSDGGITYEGPWDKLGRIAEILGLEWGGRWTSFPDRPHFQFVAGHTLQDFQNGNIDESKFA